MPCQTDFTSVFRYEEHRKTKAHAEKVGDGAETPAAAVAATSDVSGGAKEGEAGGNGEQKYCTIQGDTLCLVLYSVAINLGSSPVLLGQ